MDAVLQDEYILLTPRQVLSEPKPKARYGSKRATNFRGTKFRGAKQIGTSSNGTTAKRDRAATVVLSNRANLQANAMQARAPLSKRTNSLQHKPNSSSLLSKSFYAEFEKDVSLTMMRSKSVVVLPDSRTAPATATATATAMDAKAATIPTSPSPVPTETTSSTTSSSSTSSNQGEPDEEPADLDPQDSDVESLSSLEDLDIASDDDMDEDEEAHRKATMHRRFNERRFSECLSSAGASTYVCELHDPKCLLKDQHFNSTRVEVTKASAPASASLENSSASHFWYRISIGQVSQTFECVPANLFTVIKTLAEDEQLGEHIDIFLEMYYLRQGFRGSLKRMCTSVAKLSEEVLETLERLADIDTVLRHNCFLHLIGAQNHTDLYIEIQRMVASHEPSPRGGGASSDPGPGPVPNSNSSQTQVDLPTPEDHLLHNCLCADYCNSIKVFARYCETLHSLYDRNRFRSVASESTMLSHHGLTFVQDTVFFLEKRDFRFMKPMRRCVVYGFGRNALFEIARISKREWALRAYNHPTNLLVLSMEKYVISAMLSETMVCIKRMFATDSRGRQAQEDVCFVRKVKKPTRGFDVLLVSEIISCGKTTTCLNFDKVQRVGAVHDEYVGNSEICGGANHQQSEIVQSSCIVDPRSPHRHLQQVHVTAGSDALVFLALAVSFNLLLGRGEINLWRF